MDRRVVVQAGVRPRRSPRTGRGHQATATVAVYVVSIRVGSSTVGAPGTVRRIGTALRSALNDVTVGLADGTAESPSRALNAWVGGLDLHDRERDTLAALVEFVRHAQRLNHRSAHIKDDTLNKGGPPVTHEELRRACFLTAVACYEIDRATGGGSGSAG